MPVRALTGCDTVPCYFGIGKGTASWLSFCLISMLLMVIENVIAQSIEFLSACYLLLLLVWHAPLGARSAKRRHQSPEWTLLSHINASSRERLLDFRSCWIVFIHVVPWCPGGLLQFSEGEAVMIFLASVSFVVSAMWPNRERRRAWTIANRRGCPVVPLTASFRRWWYHLIHNSFRKHHWSRASILSTSLLVTAQHSELYRKISRMQLLYNFSLVGMVILDFQIWLSRFCTAARVMALRRKISRELWVVEWTRELWQSYVCARNINWRFGHKTSSSPPKLCSSSSNHWDIHSECQKSSSASHRVAFIRKQRSTRIEVPGTVWLTEGHYTENTEAKASPSEYWTSTGVHHASHQNLWMQECHPMQYSCL